MNERGPTDLHRDRSRENDVEFNIQITLLCRIFLLGHTLISHNHDLKMSLSSYGVVLRNILFRTNRSRSDDMARMAGNNHDTLIEVCDGKLLQGTDG